MVPLRAAAFSMSRAAGVTRAWRLISALVMLALSLDWPPKRLACNPRARAIRCRTADHYQYQAYAAAVPDARRCARPQTDQFDQKLVPKPAADRGAESGHCSCNARSRS